MAEYRKKIEGFDFEPEPYTTMHVIWGGPVSKFKELNSLKQQCFLEYVYSNANINSTELDIEQVYNTRVGLSPIAVPKYVAVNCTSKTVYANSVIDWATTSKQILECLKYGKDVFVYNSADRLKLLKYIGVQRFLGDININDGLVIKVLQDMTFPECMYDKMLDLAAHIYPSLSFSTEYITNDMIYNSSYTNSIKEQCIGFAELLSKISERLC